MAHANYSTCVQWMWKSNKNPWSKSQPDEWSHYSDVENMIIEEAFTSKQTYVILDDYHIDFKHRIQIGNKNTDNQRPVKRLVRERDDKRLREERFMPDPMAPKRPYGGLYGWISPFIEEVKKNLKLEENQWPAQDKTIVPMLVEKAALGIIEEGKLVGKQYEAECMAKQLLKKKDEEIKEIWKYCAHLYTKESFLYKKLNETMRLIGNEEHEQVWRSKIHTFGPFCLLLWDNPFDEKPSKIGETIYRGANLTDALIASYMNDCTQNPKPHRSFQAFTSCSRNRSKAEQFGNALFIMKITYAFTVDLSQLSEYPNEEEELISPGVCFTVDCVEFDNVKNKHLIYLNLQHRHNRTQHSQLSNNSSVQQNPNATAGLRNDDVFRVLGLLNDYLLTGTGGDTSIGLDADGLVDFLHLLTGAGISPIDGADTDADRALALGADRYGVHRR